MGSLTGRMLDQRADVRGNIALNARPAITANWRLEPNLTAQASIGDANLSVAGVRLNLSREVKPLLDRAVNEQVAALQGRLRADPFIEQIARREWAKLCRSIPLGKVTPGAPDLWLEVRPVRAVAAQPRIDASAVTLTVGVQAETRITRTESKPECPFPATIELVPPLEQGRVAIGVPIDLPFTEVNKLIEAQLKGRTFPEDGKGAATVTINRATLAASGDRLLISLRAKAVEKKSWFGFGADATVHVWGKPVLDPEDASAAADRHHARRGVRSRVRPARHGGARRHSVSEGCARRECAHRPEAVRRQCAQEHRGCDRGFPPERAGRAGRCRRDRVCGLRASSMTRRRCA